MIFEASKRSVVNSISLLRNKILVAEQSGAEGEELRIMDDLQMLHKIYERVNEQKKPKIPEVSRKTPVMVPAITFTCCPSDRP